MAIGRMYISVPARWGFGADAVLDVFKSLTTSVNVCVISDGVL